MMRNPVQTSYQDWHGYEEEKPTEWRHFDTLLQLCFLEWLHLDGYTWMVTLEWLHLNGYTWMERVLLRLVSPYLMFFIIDYQRGILSYQIIQLPCRARGARAHNLFSHIPFRIGSFVHETFLFLSVNWCVQYIVTTHWMYWLNMSHFIIFVIVAN